MPVIYVDPLTYVVTPVALGNQPIPSGRYVSRYVGEQYVPQDVKRRRRLVHDAMRRLGTPVVIKHRFNPEDVENGIAEVSPNVSDAYGQSRREDPLSYGVGLVSVEKSDNEWITPYGELVKSETQPSPEHTPAPKYRGYGQGILTYIIEPDIAIDTFRAIEGGALIKIQQATAQAPWYPEINDNDLIVRVELSPGWKIRKTFERFEARQTNPVSVRGLDRRGRREYTEDGGNRFMLNQLFEMNLVPQNDILYKVEIDR